MLFKVTIFVESGTLVLEEVPSAQQHFLNMITTQEVCYRAVLHVCTYGIACETDPPCCHPASK